MQQYTGSNWLKYDLHIHTAYSHAGNQNHGTIREIAEKVISEKLDVIGVTNYFIVEEKEFGELKLELGENAFVIPNFEFRINEKNKDGEYINIHVLFNPHSTNLSKIHESLGRIELTNIAGDTKVYCTLENIKKIGIEKITVALKDLTDQLDSDFKALEDYIIVGVDKGYGGFFPGKGERDTELAIKIDSLSDCIFGKKEEVDFFLNRIHDRKTSNLIPKPVIYCSDAHKIDDIGSKYTWIKGEPTFEGLKQIIFEPIHRIEINETKPREPIRKIERIKFNFPHNTIIKKMGSISQQELCIKYLNEDIFFSPYFTCLIGGRGTGKSTIINILAEKLGNRTDFFNLQGNQIFIDDKIFNFENDDQNLIEVIGTEEIEFVSQGTIEKLAEGNELTNLIFAERIKGIESEYVQLEIAFNSHATKLNENILLLNELKDLSYNLKENEKEKSNSQKIIDSEKDPKYIEISDSIKQININTDLILASKDQYGQLIKKLKDIITDTSLNQDLNDYEKRITEILAHLQLLDELTYEEDELTVKLKEYEITDSILDDLQSKLIKENEKLVAFFEEKGTSEESIKDSQKASDNIARLEKLTETMGARILFINNKIRENDEYTIGIKDNYERTEVLTHKSIEAINIKLQSKNENVLGIKYIYEFNIYNFEENLFEEFKQVFKSDFIPNTQLIEVSEVLFLVDPFESLLLLSYEDFIIELNSQIDTKGYNRGTNYVSIIINIFSNKLNYMIYKNIICKHRYNLPAYIKIKGFYGDIELNSCSFGQRCTAVIVTLLMTGVKPLVIDEPEAHLDNKLIADYLVDLIKTKKLDRQIIFATHNSNFVINGDAELIHILEIPDKNIYTNIISTTIENVDNRTKLLKLEGGKEAFLSRENKYGLKR